MLAFALLVGCVAAGCGGSSMLRPSALAKQADAVRSLAAEGALLAGDAASGKTTSVYLHAHASELSSSASKSTTSLGSAKTAPSLEPRLRHLRRISAQVAAELRLLGGASSAESRTLARELQAAADASKKVSDGLA